MPWSCPCSSLCKQEPWIARTFIRVINCNHTIRLTECDCRVPVFNPADSRSVRYHLRSEPIVSIVQVHEYFSSCRVERRRFVPDGGYSPTRTCRHRGARDGRRNRDIAARGNSVERPPGYPTVGTPTSEDPLIPRTRPVIIVGDVHIVTRVDYDVRLFTVVGILSGDLDRRVP